ncbi:Hypp1327 [Branchiostoma lanceolatum]|uniref:Hypp1327 protein n=1 Tax=Branchiostoma lanceolatum TaxID=7740 RepID=A0A8J9ZGJ4_BRALA|nr:Hypp1327 [Branchiostoma lanceolatum]
MTEQKQKDVAELLTEAIVAELQESSASGALDNNRISDMVRRDVSVATVHPSPHFPYGTERGTTVIGYYATFDCSAQLLPGSLLKQVVMNSRTRLEQAAGGEMIGDPVMFIRGPSNLQALNTEYFLGLSTLGLLALLLFCAGLQGTTGVCRYRVPVQNRYFLLDWSETTGPEKK